jgi:hypothetical protein
MLSADHGSISSFRNVSDTNGAMESVQNMCHFETEYVFNVTTLYTPNKRFLCSSTTRNFCFPDVQMRFIYIKEYHVHCRPQEEKAGE